MTCLNFHLSRWSTLCFVLRHMARNLFFVVLVHFLNVSHGFCLPLSYLIQYSDQDNFQILYEKSLRSKNTISNKAD